MLTPTHEEGRARPKQSLADVRAEAAPHARTYKVLPDTSWLRGAPETVWRIKTYDGGELSTSGWHRDEASAHRVGRVWVRDGIEPAHQPPSYPPHPLARGETA